MKKKIAALLFILVSVAALSACGTDDIDVSPYKNSTITLSGLEKKDIDITVGQLKKLECTTKKTNSTSDKIGTVRATGPWLDTVLTQYNKKQENFSKITIYGTDDYNIVLDKQFLSENQIMLAFGIDGKPLESDSVPVRIIIPDSDSAYWIRMVKKIKFE